MNMQRSNNQARSASGNDRRRKSNNRGNGHDHSNLSMCAAAYAGSLANPFTGPDDACIPDFPALMTGKSKCFARGRFSTSNNPAANGFGYISFTPECGAANDDANFVQTNGPADTAVSIGFVGANLGYTSNSPYNTAAYGNTGLQYRVVSAGLRIRYVGAEFYRGGSIVGLQSPSHATQFSLNSAGQLLYREALQMGVPDQEWTTLLYRPVEKSDYDFKYTFPVAGPATGSHYMAFTVNGYDSTGANPATFEWEAFVNLEIQGAIVVNKTPSHVDTVGMGAVNAATVLAPALHSPVQNPIEPVANAFVSFTSHYLGSATSNPVPPSSGSKMASMPTQTETSLWSKFLGVAEKALPYIADAAMSFF